MALTKDDYAFQERINDYEEIRREVPQATAVANVGLGGLLSSDESSFGFIALTAYLADEHRISAEWARRCLNSTEEYFFGSWRDEEPSGNYGDQPPDRAWQDRTCSWSSAWQDALVWCSSLGEWDRLLRFAEYPRDDVQLDIDQKKENRAWLLVLAGVLRGRPREQLQEHVATILEGRRRRERLLLWTLEHILEGAEEEASGSLADYATYYKTAEFPKMDVTLKVAMDATFLVHYAEYTDVEIEVPEKLKDHIVRFPAEHVETR